MAVKYRRWDADDRVSAQWFAVLERGAEGRRRLVPRHRRAPDAGRAAGPLCDTYHAGGARRPPSRAPTAPHIRAGRPDHAIDVNALDGGAGRLAAWLRSARRARHVPRARRDWHIEVPRDDLVRLAEKLADPLAGYPAKERRWIRAYDALVRLKHAGHDPADGPRAAPPACAALMTNRRKAIWRAAQHSGWHRLKRRARYRSLLARTTQPREGAPPCSSILKGRRPDITAAQIGAVLVAGVPAIATLLTAFGVGDLERRPAGRALRRAHLVGRPRRPS